MIHPEEVTCVILTGGKSTRMGRDKAFVPIKGRPLIAWTIEGAGKIFTRILLSANAPELYKPFGLPVVEDLENGWGALGGIHAGLHAASTEWIFALAVDMPLVSPPVVQAILDQVDERWAAVIPHGLGYHQPFHAAYGPKAMSILDLRSQQPYHIHTFVDRPEVRHLTEQTMKKIDPKLRCFLNANTPGELEEIVALLTNPGGAG